MKPHQNGESSGSVELDSIDLGILDLLQQNCKQSLATIGGKVGLSAPSIMDRIHKMEEAGVIAGYSALVDAKKLGKDVTAFIGVSLGHPRHIEDFLSELAAIHDVLESHHVTGEHTLMLKAKTRNTASLERLIDWIRRVEGVTRTETNVVLSSQRESVRVAVDADGTASHERSRRGQRSRRAPRRIDESEQEGTA